MLPIYRSVFREVDAERIEKKSRFLAKAAPVSSVDEAEAFIAGVRQEHSGANHNVPAYIIGMNAEIQKASDDGEPSGTAGSPILEVLKAHQLVNTVIVVTRYFGGTLLGRGGLIRAYAGTAKDALMEAGVALYTPHRRVDVTVDYSESGRIENFLQTKQLQVEDIIYLADVTFQLVLLPEQVEPTRQQIQELTADQFLWQEGEEVYGRQHLRLKSQ